MFLTIEISKSEEAFNARCVELEINTSADTAEKAMEKLKKIIDFYMSTAREDITPSGKAPSPSEFVGPEH